MKANILMKFLKDLEIHCKQNNKTLKDVDVNYRRSDDDDIQKTDYVGVDLFDKKTNTKVESIIIMGRY
jgi:hypothetical protein